LDKQDNYSNGWDQQEFPEFAGRQEERIVPDNFRRSRLGFFTLFFLLIFWPLLSIATIEDPVEVLKTLSLSPIYLVYIPTMLIQWVIFGLVYLTVWRERTGLKGIGLKRIRLIDFFWAIAFVLASNVILAGLAYLLKLVGLEIPIELELILPKTTAEKILWIFLSFTAGFCEETIFRGYLMTRIKMYAKLKGWIIPVILASLSFGSGHAYQGLGGLILIGVYGVMFALLFLRTKTLWPAVIAHFLQDAMAPFMPMDT